jgi:hypothetical protein
MTTLQVELYQALKEAKVSEETAKAAAVAAAAAQESPRRLDRVETDIKEIKGKLERLEGDTFSIKADLNLVKWMVGFVLAACMSILWKMLK